MATFYRRDEWVTDAMGNAISGADVYVCSQPATTTTLPPSPLQQIYADPAGTTPITQPVQTDGFGHAFYYVATGTYTVVYYSPLIGTTVLADQDVAVSSGNITFPITVAEGGTNATTAAGARTNLGAAASGANSDITSLTGVPNTNIDTTGYTYLNAFNSDTNGVQITTQTWAGQGYTGVGIGVSSSTSATLITPNGIGTANVTTLNLNVNTKANIGSVFVGSTGAGLIRSFSPTQPLNIGGQGTPAGPGVILSSDNVSITPGVGQLQFGQFYPTQSTVGSSGTASPPPTDPLIWVEVDVYVAGVLTPGVMPVYKRS